MIMTGSSLLGSAVRACLGEMGAPEIGDAAGIGSLLLLAGVPIVSLCIPCRRWYNVVMLDRQPDQPSLGGLWRDVLNFLTEDQISPDLYLPLADAVAPKWASWTYFLGHAARKLTEDRAELEADVARARIGWRIWAERREELRAFAQKVARHPVDDETLEKWWLSDARGESALWDGSIMGVGDKRAAEFQRRMKLSDEEQLALRPVRQQGEFGVPFVAEGSTA